MWLSVTARRGFGGAATAVPAIGKNGVKPFDAGGSAGADLGLAAGSGNEGAAAIVPGQVAARLAVEVNRRREAARHGDQIAGDAAGCAADGGRDGADRGAMHCVDAVTTSGVDHHHDFGTGAHQRGGGALHIVSAARNDNAAAGNNGKAFDIGAHGSRQHDPRAIIAAEQQRPFDAAGGDDDAAGADTPEALRNGAGRCAGFDKPFDQRDKIVIMVTRRRRAGQDAATGGDDAVANSGGPCQSRHARDGCCIAQQRAAEAVVVFDQHDAASGGGGSIGGGEAGRAAADDQHVAKGGAMLIMIGVGDARCRTEPGRAADEMFKEQPYAGAAEEGFVVETGGQEARGKADDRANIKAQRRPAVLAGGDKAFGNEDIGGAGIGLGSAAEPGGDQRIGFFHAGAQHAARAMVFEAAAKHHDAAGQQCRCQRVTGEPGVAATVELEGEGAGAVDMATGFEAITGHGAGFQSVTAAMTWVTVWRSIRNQARQPRAWRHNSADTPRGLVRV